MPMHPRQASLLSTAQSLQSKLASKEEATSKVADVDKEAATPILWKYVDPDTMSEFFLPIRQMTVRSPYTGKMFTTRPERYTLSEVGKELRQDLAAPAPMI